MTASLYAPPSVVGTIPELQAFDGNLIRDGSVVQVINAVVALDASNAPGLFKFALGNASADTTAKFIIAPSVNPAGGKWIRIDPFIDLMTPVSFNTADTAVLWTIPTGFRVRPTRLFQEVGTPYSGGAASSIGISSSNANYNTKGDLLGAAAGDVAANLTAGFRGTVGTKLAAAAPPVVLVAGDTIRWDRITSAFTAGAGTLHCCLEIIPGIP